MLEQDILEWIALNLSNLLTTFICTDFTELLVQMMKIT